MNEYAMELKQNIEKDFINSELNMDTELRLLRDYIINDNIIGYPNKKYIGALFTYMCDYTELGLEYNEEVFNKVNKYFKDLFPHTGKIYRGITTSKVTDDTSLSSWTIDRDIAFRFIECSSEYTILERDVTGVLFLSDLMFAVLEQGDDYYYSEIENWLGEDECLCDTVDYEIIETGKVDWEECL